MKLTKSSHNHSEEQKDLIKRRAIVDMKKNVLERPDLSVREVFRNVLESNFAVLETSHGTEEIACAMPTYSNVRTVLSRERSTVRPPLPEHRRDIDLAGVWAENKRGEPFLLFDNTYPIVSTRRILGFSTHGDMEILLRAPAIFMDGTFRVVPSLFAQLYTLHAYYMGQMFPLLYFLLPDKEKLTYKRMLELLKEYAATHGLPFPPARFHIDYEASALLAIAETFIGVEVKGCNFHYTQAVWRNVQELGLTRFYKSDPAVI